MKKDDEENLTNTMVDSLLHNQRRLKKILKTEFKRQIRSKENSINNRSLLQQAEKKLTKRNTHDTINISVTWPFAG